jgi:hypothetical protein
MESEDEAVLSDIANVSLLEEQSLTRQNRTDERSAHNRTTPVLNRFNPHAF